MEMPDNLREAVLWFAEFENCREFMIALRWPDGAVVCPRCGLDKNIWIAKERVWKCYGKHDHAKFSLKTGTIFEDSPISLEKWLPAAWLIINCKNGISSYELSRDLGITQKSAWFMLHRIRLAMKSGTFEKLSGEVEADETFVGGKVKNMHRDRKVRLQKTSQKGDKTVVLGLLERNGHVRAAVAPTRKFYEVQKHVTENLEPGSTLFTDEYAAYQSVAPGTFTHEIVNKMETYVRGRVHVNGMENFWSLLKRTLHGTYVSVDPAHLQAYVDEQAYRFNNREFTDAERFADVMKQIVGKCLTYDELIGKSDKEQSSTPTA